MVTRSQKCCSRKPALLDAAQVIAGTGVVLVSPRLPQGGYPGRKLLSTQESAAQLA